MEISERHGNCGPVAIQALGGENVARTCARYGWTDGGSMRLVDVIAAAEDCLGTEHKDMRVYKTRPGTGRTLCSEPGRWLVFVPGHVFGIKDGRPVGMAAGHLDLDYTVAIGW